MKVDEIRPEELVRENLELHRKDVALLMERASEFDILFSCPVCRRSAYEVALPVVFTKDGFIHKRCGACGSVYISPRPTRKMLLDYYSKAESIRHWATRLYPKTVEGRRELLIKPRVQEVLRACMMMGRPPRSFLDLGAGDGSFCHEMMRRFPDHHIVALEPSTDLALMCHMRGVPIRVAPVEGFDYKEAADVVTAFELLEHLYDPWDLLYTAHRALCKGGILYLTTPNIEGFDLATLGQNALNFGGPNHLQLLTRCALSRMLDEVGFEVLALDTPGKLDAETVHKAVVDGTLDISGQPFLIEVLHDRWGELGGPFQEFLADHGMSSHMRAVARKR